MPYVVPTCPYHLVRPYYNARRCLDPPKGAWPIALTDSLEGPGTGGAEGYALVRMEWFRKGKVGYRPAEGIEHLVRYSLLDITGRR